MVRPSWEKEVCFSDVDISGAGLASLSHLRSLETIENKAREKEELVGESRMDVL
jgi:hypothetical protein